MRAIVTTIRSQTKLEKGVYLFDVLYKGDKDELGEAILEQVGSKPGFGENEFEGPDDDGGKIIFTFK